MHTLNNMAEEKIKELLELELFNDEQIEELASMDPDDHEFLNETLGDFLEQVDTGLAEMKGFRKDKKFRELGEKAHFLKGSCLALGCERLGRICETLQHLKAPDEEQLKMIDACLDIIDDTWASTRPFVEQYIVNEEDEGEDEDGEGEDQ